MGHRPDNDARARITELGRAYADALLAGDGAAAETAIREAMDAKLTAAEIDDEIIAPALWLVGDLWERGQISVADEHIATEITMRVLALSREAQRAAQARGDHRVLLAAPPDEQHVVALRMVDELLREAGYDVLMLGADVPPEALAAAVSRRRPHVVCMTSTMPSGTDMVLASIGGVQQRWPAVRFVVGGRGLSSRVQPRPGVDVCRRVSDVVEAVDAMVRGAGLN
jgi:MerR family transcriptional regulator, light-induced transcriptional regulator